MSSITRLYGSLPPGYITRSTFAVLLGGTGLFIGAEYYKNPEIFHRKYVKFFIKNQNKIDIVFQLIPMVHRLFDAETAHRLGVTMAKHDITFGTAGNQIDYPELHCTLFGRELDSPIGFFIGLFFCNLFFRFGCRF